MEPNKSNELFHRTKFKTRLKYSKFVANSFGHIFLAAFFGCCCLHFAQKLPRRISQRIFNIQPNMSCQTGWNTQINCDWWCCLFFLLSHSHSNRDLCKSNPIKINLLIFSSFSISFTQALLRLPIVNLFSSSSRTIKTSDKRNKTETDNELCAFLTS